MRALLAACSFAALLATAALAQAPPHVVIPPVALSAAWTSVPLPELPLDITVHDGAFWVSGANEMIAESQDGGQHWTLRHWSPQGAEMLFSLAFQGSAIHAFGTAGTHLISTDGGATWTSQPFSNVQALMDVQFSDAKHAYASTARGYATSDNGGKNWKFKNWDDSFAGLAVSDATHAAFFRFTRDGGRLTSTNDAGRHWEESKAPAGYLWLDLRALPNGFEISGENIKTSAPTTAAWSAGKWTMLPASAPESACTVQGCRISGGWEDLSNPPQRWGLPMDTRVAGDWATVGETFCAVSDTLRCLRGRQPWVAPATPSAAPASAQKISPAACVTCRPPQYPEADRKADRQGEVVLHVVVGTDGHVKFMVPVCAPSAALARAAMDAVRAWVYHPMKVDGKLQEIDSNITIRFFLR